MPARPTNQVEKRRVVPTRLGATRPRCCARVVWNPLFKDLPLSLPILIAVRDSSVGSRARQSGQHQSQNFTILCPPSSFGIVCLNETLPCYLTGHSQQKACTCTGLSVCLCLPRPFIFKIPIERTEGLSMESIKTERWSGLCRANVGRQKLHRPDTISQHSRVLINFSAGQAGCRQAALDCTVHTALQRSRNFYGWFNSANYILDKAV